MSPKWSMWRLPFVTCYGGTASSTARRRNRIRRRLPCATCCGGSVFLRQRHNPDMIRRRRTAAGDGEPRRGISHIKKSCFSEYVIAGRIARNSDYNHVDKRKQSVLPGGTVLQPVSWGQTPEY